MTSKEAAIIRESVENALTWGLGMVSEARRNLAEEGIRWRPDHETYIFYVFVDPGCDHPAAIAARRITDD